MEEEELNKNNNKGTTIGISTGGDMLGAPTLPPIGCQQQKIQA